jgi:predicted nucleic acid-binding protein
VTLVDTSIWVRVFQRHDPLLLEEVVDLEDVVTCLPVIQEVLQGFREERQWRVARDSMLALPLVESPMEADVFLEAATLYRSARRRGLTVRSSVDCLIAACALRHDLEVLHHDRDFRVLAEVSPLRVRGE